MHKFVARNQLGIDALAFALNQVESRILSKEGPTACNKINVLRMEILGEQILDDVLFFHGYSFCINTCPTTCINYRIIPAKMESRKNCRFPVNGSLES